MAINMNWSMPLGDTRTIPFTALKSDGTPFDLTGQTLVLNVSVKLPSGGIFMFQKSSASGGITFMDALNGLANINMLPADTASLAAGVYDYDVIATSGAGVKTTLTIGKLTLTDHSGR